MIGFDCGPPRVRLGCEYTLMDSVTTADVLVYIRILVAIMLVVVLYHALFIVVDLRKILRRVEEITEQLESIIMKPINVADHILAGIVEYLNAQGEAKEHGKKKHS